MPSSHPSGSRAPQLGALPPAARAAAARALDVVLEATVAGSFGSPGFRARRMAFGWQPLPGLDGRHVLLTGATSGIGRAAAESLVRLGARLAIVGRDPGRTAAAAESLSRLARGIAPPRGEQAEARRAGTDVRWYQADLGSLAQCRQLVAQVADDWDRVDVLVHNAGALLADWSRTDEGFERTWATQVLGPHTITTGLLGLLRAGTEPRVITVSSGGMYAEPLRPEAAQMPQSDYDGVRAYARAKRAQVVMTEQWARRVPGPVAVHSMHPGWADTPGVAQSLPRFHTLTRPILRSPEQGADTIVWLAGCSPIPGPSGSFWLDRRRRGTVRLPWTASPPGAAEALWARVCRESGADPAIRARG